MAQQGGTSSTASPAPTEHKKICFGGVLTPNAKILLISMGFFSTITTAQVFAAEIANSSALMADCVSMGVDALSYGFNLISEAWPSENKRTQERNQLFGAAVSLGLLLYFTAVFMTEAYGTITHQHDFDSSCCDALPALKSAYGEDFRDDTDNWQGQPHLVAKKMWANARWNVKYGIWMNPGSGCKEQMDACTAHPECRNEWLRENPGGKGVDETLPPEKGSEKLISLVECIMDHASCLVAHARADGVATGSLCYNNSKSFSEDKPQWDNEKLCKTPQADSCVWTGVDPRIVFAFALFGLLFDAGSLLAFKHYGQKFSLLVGADVESGERGVEAKAEALNMSSALLHVLSDCLRSITTLVESILIFAYPATPSYIFDGYATLIVTASIMVGGMIGVGKWCQQLRDWIARRNDGGVDGGGYVAAEGGLNAVN